MDPATDTNNATNKRVRITSDPPLSNTEPTRPSPIEAPKKLLLSFIRGHLASLPPSLQPILETSSITHSNLLIKAWNKNKQIERMMTDKEYIPKSCRIEFKLSMSKEATKNSAYEDLKNETDNLIAGMRTSLKNQVIKAARIELVTLHTALITDLATSIRLIVDSFYTTRVDGITVDQVTAKMVYKHHADLFTHLECSLDIFKDIYVSTHKLTGFPLQATSTQATRVPGPTRSAYFSQPSQPLAIADEDDEELADVEIDTSNNYEPPDNVIIDDIIARAFANIYKLFITAWDQYTTQCDKNVESIRLKKIYDLHMKAASTDEYSKIADGERSADQAQLHELISKMSDEKNKTLINKLTRLQKEMKELKTSQRGRTSNGASTKQTNQKTGPSTSNSRTKTRPKGRNAPKADAAAAATTSVARKETVRKKRPNLRPKGGRGKTKSGRS